MYFQGSTRSIRRVASAIAVATAIAWLCPGHVAAARDSESKWGRPLSRSTVISAPKWPSDLCRPQRGHRITTTGIQDGYVAEPATGAVRRPHLTSRQAYAKFVHLYGRQGAAERNATQIRYGTFTTWDVLFRSANVLEEEPLVRRTPGWIITNCAARSRPHDIEHRPGHPGRLTYVVADRRKPVALGWSYEYREYDGTKATAFGSSIVASPRTAKPPLSSTRYYSTPWTLVARGDHRHSVLIKYAIRPCYSFDHINLDQDVSPRHGGLLSVILSTGPNGSCAKQSAIAPYMSTVADEVLGVLHHGETGPFTFVPIGSSSGG